jgi:tetratricopeptide (TPR) repeat protein
VPIGRALDELAFHRPSSEHYDRFKKSRLIADLNASQEVVIKSLGLCDHKDAHRALVEVINNAPREDAVVLGVAIWAIARRNDKRAIETLHPLLSNRALSAHFAAIETALQYLCSGESLVPTAVAAQISDRLQYWDERLRYLPAATDQQAWSRRDARSVFWEKRLFCTTQVSEANWRDSDLDLLQLDEVAPVANRASQALARFSTRSASEAKTALQASLALAESGNWRDYARSVLDPGVAQLMPIDSLFYARGRGYEAYGDNESAALFFDQAADVNNLKPIYPFVALDSITRVDGFMFEAIRRAEAIILQPNPDPALLCKAADVIVLNTRHLPDSAASPQLARAATEIQRALALVQENSQYELRPSVTASAYLNLGICHAHLHRYDEALAAYTLAVNNAPNWRTKQTALIARGIFLYEINNEAAIKDLKQAIDKQSDLVWPYLFLSHAYAVSGLYRDCLAVTSAGIGVATSAKVRAELYEFKAIALAETGAPAETVKDAFRHAQSLAPNDRRLRKNIEVYQRSLSRQSSYRPRFTTPSDLVTLKTTRSLDFATSMAA